MKLNINELSKQIYAQNKEMGWWDNPDRCIYQTLQLVNTEIAEATEGDRKDLMDDHLPHRKMAEVEPADALIRLLDLAGRYGWGYRRKQESPYISGYSNVGQAHFWLTKMVCSIGELIFNKYDLTTISKRYSLVVNSIFYVAGREKYDLEAAVAEKLEYNKSRSDHKRENRAKEGGKKY